MRQYPLERLIKNIGTNNKTVAALLQPRFCAYKKAVIAVRVSGGHLCDAEAPTEPAGETAVRRVAIRFPSPSSLRSRVSGCGNPFSLKGNTDSFALYHSCGAQKLFSLGARTTFDRGASFCSLLPAPQALATSLRMTSRLVAASVTRCAVTCRSVIAVRVSGGHLRDAEAPTEPAGETAVRRVAIRIFPIKENAFFCPAPEIKLIFGCNYT